MFEGGLAILDLPQDCIRSSLQEDEMGSKDDNHFHLEMSLKVLIWAGPIPVTIGGSMLYEQSSRNTLEKGKFSYSLTKTTKTKMLSMDHFKFLFEDEHAAEEIRALIESGEATHIISGQNKFQKYSSVISCSRRNSIF